MKIAIGCDHRGMEVEVFLVSALKRDGHELVDFGCPNEEASDYPDIAFPIAEAVATGEVDRGILIDGSGIGMSIAANKVKGVRAALVHDEVGADMSRRHNDANVLCLPADMLGHRIIERIVQVWLESPFDGGRHERRLQKILDKEGQSIVDATVPRVAG